ncbi:MAG: STAS domain-containing protein [Spirochaetales bacterium]|nr:STAS domain-containing protein [Spirochaetales bacterium]
MLEVSTEKERKIYIIRLKGRIDSITARDFEDFFGDMLKMGQRFFILDGTDLAFISSAGIAALVKFIRRLDAVGGGACFLHVNQEISHLMEFFGLATSLPVFADDESARSHLSRLATKEEKSFEIRPMGSILPEASARPVTPEPPAESPTEATVPNAGRSPLPLRPTKEPFTAAAPVLRPTFSIKDPEKVRFPRLEQLKRRQASWAESRERWRASLAQMEQPQPERPPMPRQPEPKKVSPQPGGLKMSLETERGAFTEPRIFICEQCGANLRAYQAGPHVCPVCRVNIEVHGDGTLSFLEKL